MKKHESIFHAKLMKWLQYNKEKFPTSFLFETKVVRPDSNAFPFRELSTKEERLLKLAKHKGIIQTHSDLNRLGTNCDGSVIKGGGFIFLHWVRAKNKRFYIIDIDSFTEYRDKKSKRKSLTEEEVTQIGQIAELN